MTLPLQPEQPTVEGSLGAAPLASLLERGLRYAQQGFGAEAAALFAMVREQLSSSRSDLVDLLEGFLRDYADYQRSEHTFKEACVRFTSAHLEQQARIASFEAALSAFMGDANSDQCAQPSVVAERELATSSPSSILDEQHRYGEAELSSPLNNHTGELTPLSITCFGRFEVRRGDKYITLCANRNGQRILRYLVNQPGRSAMKDVLQTLCWPDDEAEVASRKLHLAISALRRSLSTDSACEPASSYIVCRHSSYALHPDAPIQIDVDEFLHCYRSGQRNSERRIAWYERACQIYKGPLLPEDAYSDWSFMLREQCALAYLAMANDLTAHYLATRRYEDALQSAHAVLKENRCDETAHRHLIQIYTALGRRSEALQQYQRCERILREELGVKPMPETILAIQAHLSYDPHSS